MTNEETNEVIECAAKSLFCQLTMDGIVGVLITQKCGTRKFDYLSNIKSTRMKSFVVESLAALINSTEHGEAQQASDAGRNVGTVLPSTNSTDDAKGDLSEESSVMCIRCGEIAVCDNCGEQIIIKSEAK